MVIAGTPAGQSTSVLMLELLLPETRSSGIAAATVAVFAIAPLELGAVANRRHQIPCTKNQRDTPESRGLKIKLTYIRPRSKPI